MTTPPLRRRSARDWRLRQSNAKRKRQLRTRRRKRSASDLKPSKNRKGYVSRKKRQPRRKNSDRKPSVSVSRKRKPKN
jgi:hypothetical protein